MTRSHLHVHTDQRVFLQFVVTRANLVIELRLTFKRLAMSPCIALQSARTAEGPPCPKQGHYGQVGNGEERKEKKRKEKKRKLVWRQAFSRDRRRRPDLVRASEKRNHLLTGRRRRFRFLHSKGSNFELVEFVSRI